MATRDPNTREPDLAPPEVDPEARGRFTRDPAGTGREPLERTRARTDARPAEPAEGYAEATSGWRAQVAGAAAVNIIAGVWLIFSPWIVGYTSDDAYWNPIVFGAIITVLAVARTAGAYRLSGLSWVNAAIGVWLFVSGFWLADSAAASWNVWILGAIVFVLALISADGTERLGAASRATR